MDDNKLISFINESFLKPLLEKESITDISYNGETLFYQDNVLGRKISDILINKDQVADFIRQIANLSEKQFSYTVPILDISIGRYRINAVHQSLCRVGDDKSLSFSIRIASKESRIHPGDSFLDIKAHEILLDAIKQKSSIVIAGPTGSGKTELQKYLLKGLPNYSRVIVIDNVQELDVVRSNKLIDLTSWQVNPNSKEGTFEELIRNSLRSNPDWLVIAESRGREMKDVLNAVMTGHPLISTLHSKDINSIPHRMAKMVEMGDTSQDFDEILEDILEHIQTYVFVNRYIDETGKVVRYIENIARSQKNNRNLTILYSKEG